MKRSFKKAAILCILMMVASLGFAQTFVQQNTGESSTAVATLTIPYTTAQVAGNMNIVAVGWVSATTITSVTDTVGNTYVVASPKVTSGSVNQSIYYAKNIAAGSNTVTVHFSAASTFPDARILEYSGLDKTAPFDVQAGAAGNSAAASSGNATTTASNDLIFGAGTTAALFTIAGSGFTSRQINSFGSIAEDKVGAIAGAYSATGTTNVSATWVMQMAAFKSTTPAPTVTAIVANSGPIAGGTAVTITGTGFLVGATATIGGTAATSVVVVNGTTITAVTSAHTVGLVNVVVTNANTLSGTLTNGFTYTAPAGINFVQVASATPHPSAVTVAVTYPQTQTVGNLNIIAIGWNGSTSTITSVVDSRGNTYQIAGTLIQQGGTGPLSQAIYYAKNIVGLSSNTVTVTFNQAATSPDVRILEYSGLDTVNPLDATAGAIGTSTTPNSGAATTTAANELIFGAGMTTGGFTAAGAGYTSRIITVPDGDNAEDKTVSAISSYSTTGTLSASANWIMQMATFKTANQVIPPPTVTSISPNTGTAAGNIAATITGTGFSTGATVTVGGAAATNVVIVNSTSITITVPAHSPGVVSVIVTNTDTQSGTLTNGFTYTGIPNPAPTITSLSIVSGPATGGTNVTVTGTGFLTGATAVIGGISGINVAVLSPTSIFFMTPAHTAGVVSLVVTNTDAQAVTKPSAFTYIAAPTVVSVSPITGPTTGATSVTITGTGFTTGAIPRFGGIAATNVVVVGPTSITCKTPASSAGVVSISVTNTDSQSGTLAAAFTYTNPSPTITSINPITGTVNGGTGVIITGTGFLPGVAVTVGGTAAPSVSLLSSTSISITTPVHIAGLVSVVVTNTDTKTATLPNSFTYVALPTAPTVTSVVPGLGGTAGGNNVTITGTGFLTGAAVTIGGVPATGVIVVSSTSITATTGAHAVGVVDVIVTNANTQTGTLVNGYVYTDVVAGTTTTTPSTGSINIDGSEQSSSTPSVPASGKVVVTGICTDSCGPLSITANGHTSSASYVQGSNAGVSFEQANSTQRAVQASVQVPFLKAQKAGGLNIVVIKWNATPSVITAVTDSSGNSYGLISGPVTGFGITQAIYYAKNIASAARNSVIVTFNPPATVPDIHVYEYSGLGAFDVQSTSIGTTNPTDSGSATTNFSKELIFGAGAVCGTGFLPTGGARGLGFIQPGNGFLQRQLTALGDLGEDQTVFAAGSYKAAGFVDCSGWVMQMTSFWAGVAANNLATLLASKINADRASSVVAQVVDSTIFLTSKIAGPTTNYDLSIISCCNIQMDPSGSALTGGSDIQTTYDVGDVTVVVNSVSYTYTYGQNDTPTTIASGIALAINSDLGAVISATSSGPVVNLVSIATGSVNYTLTTSTTSQFPTPSFTATPSGPNMTGGSIQHSVSLVWPASVSPGVVGYNIYRSTVSNGPYLLIASQVPVLTYTDVTVLSGTTYYYVITSVNNLGNEGVFSNQVSVVVPSP